MAISILCKKERILRVRNLIFETLHNSIKDFIENENIELTDSLKTFIHETDQDIYGVGAVIGQIDDLKNKYDVYIFADLVKRAIEKERDYYARCDALDVMYNFHNEILKYAQELEG